MSKRILFTVCAFAVKVPVLNIHVFIIATMMNLLLVVSLRPFTDKRIFYLEIFNELISILFCYFLFAFLKPFEERGDTDSESEFWGWVTIGILAAYLLVHLTIQFVDSVFKFK
jgi:hypothetical protein